MIPRSHAGEAHPVLQHAWNRRIRGIYEEHWNTTTVTIVSLLQRLERERSSCQEKSFRSRYTM
jgi:hypothetical protein